MKDNDSIQGMEGQLIYKDEAQKPKENKSKEYEENLDLLKTKQKEKESLEKNQRKVSRIVSYKKRKNF